MALTENSIVDSIEVLFDGQIQVRRATYILRDGIQISEAYHRHVVAPGDNLDKEDARVRSIGQVVHTSDVIAAYKAAQINTAV